MDTNDAKYEEIARTYLYSINPMDEYNRLLSRYQVGSVAAGTFNETWLALYTRNLNKWLRVVEAYPSINDELSAGRISEEEYNRLIFMMRDIMTRGNK